MSSSTPQPLVAVIMGSKSDWETMKNASDTLARFGVPHESRVLSAHRTPQAATEFASGASERGLQVIIAAAGGAAHLAGVVAALTTLPVVAVPMATTVLSGIDSLLSSVQMPGGVPVAAMAIDKPGAINAAIFAAEIVGIYDARIAQRLTAYKEELSRSVAEKSARVKLQYAGKSSDGK